METTVIKLDQQSSLDDVVERAADGLIRGNLVAFPTETVYGVGARADLEEALRRLRIVKGREPDRAFTLHIAEPDDALRYAPSLPGMARRLIRKAWPGPLTLIVEVESSGRTTGAAGMGTSTVSAIYYGNTVGMRCPDDRVTSAILRRVGAPVVAASANLAGNPAPVCGEDVLNELRGRIDLLVDSGRTKYAKPSTIVHIAGSTYKVLREGVYDAGIVERMTKVRILFVCTGNTCRSPMAEGLAKRALADRLGCDPSELPAHGIEVSSAGTAGGWGGASEHAMAVMEQRGIKLTDHVSQSLSAERVQQADHIFVMTEGHKSAVLAIEPSAADRVQLLVDGRSVHDPMGGTQKEYEQCARMIEEGLNQRLQEVIV